MQRTLKGRGRPRLDVPEIDKGTEELQRKRQNLLKEGQRQETFLAESLLGVLYAHGVISRPLYETGCFFGELGYRYEPCLGYSFRSRKSVLTPLGLRTLGKGVHGFSEKADQKNIQAWRTALNVLKGAGPGPYKTVLKVVFYDHDLYASYRFFLLCEERRALQKGLIQLDTYFKGGLKDKTNKMCDWAPGLGKSTSPQRPLKESQPSPPP